MVYSSRSGKLGYRFQVKSAVLGPDAETGKSDERCTSAEWLGWMMPWTILGSYRYGCFIHDDI